MALDIFLGRFSLRPTLPLFSSFIFVVNVIFPPDLAPFRPAELIIDIPRVTPVCFGYSQR